MIELYTWTTPNGRKASVALEELELPYTVHPVHIGRGEQFEPAFLKISPNNRIPAIIDTAPADGGAPLSVFETAAIMIYLAEKSGSALYPTEPRRRADVLQWLEWQMGGPGPMFGQANWFFSNQPDNERALARYVDESIRLLGVLDRNLADREFMAGDYSLADIATYPWCAGRIQTWLPELKPGVLEGFEHVQRWMAVCAARPAVQRGMAVPEV